MQNRKSGSGFTLIEATIVIALMGMMLALAMPSMTSMLRDNQVRQNANAMVASLMAARSVAVTRNVRVALCKRHLTTADTCNNNNNWSSGWLAFEDLDSDGVRDNGEEIVENFPGFSSNTTITPTNYTNSVTFLPSGEVTTSGSFRLCVGNTKARLVRMNATGRPRTADAFC